MREKLTLRLLTGTGLNFSPNLEEERNDGVHEVRQLLCVGEEGDLPLHGSLVIRTRGYWCQTSLYHCLYV